MKKLLLIIALFTMFATACKKDTDVTAQMTWEDSEYFDLKGKWKVCIYEGIYNFIDASDYSTEALETTNTSVGSATAVFTVNFKSYENYTVVAFFDRNDNGKFDSGENCDVEYGGVDAGEAKSFELTIDY